VGRDTTRAASTDKMITLIEPVTGEVLAEHQLVAPRQRPSLLAVGELCVAGGPGGVRPWRTCAASRHVR
jgi:hypothetical protein